MSDEARDALRHAELRHAVNNMLNALSMQAELGRHFVQSGKREEADRALRQIVSDCRKYSDELRGLLPD